MKMKQLLVLVIFAAIFFSCGSQKKTSSKGVKLDIAKYLELTDSAAIYPNIEQLAMLKSVVPDDPFQPAPSISNRKFWDNIGASESGRSYYEEALSEIEKEPEVPITDAIYRRANKEGNRGIYKPRYYRTMERLEHYILAECIENQGRFLPQIEVYSKAIMAMKSWLHPNHDDDENGVLEGRRVSIDLGARKFGSVLALAKVLLEDQLSEELRNEIAPQIQRRIIDTYLKSCKDLDRNNGWIKSTSNWNSVCTSGTLFSIIAISQNPDERLVAIGSALNSMQYYLSGFGEDGYCSEGIGYWRYGFGHYLYLAQFVYDYTDGKIDLFDAGNPEKLRNVGNFPAMFEIQNQRCAPFSDGFSTISNGGDNFAKALSAKHYGAIKPKYIQSGEAVEQLIFWADSESFTFDENAEVSTQELPDYSYFDDFGMVISRGKQDVPLSIAMKAGHNRENHNHMDVGTYSIVLNEDIMTGDIGRPSYIAGAFSDDNPARSSWGHPVPRIDNTLQSKGREFRGDITSAEFADNLDRVVMDIKAAYEIPALNSLVRTMENDKSGQGAISITDEFSLSKPVDFGVAIMTLSDYEIIDAKTVILTENDQKLKAEITSDDGSFTIKDELVPVEKLREGAPAYRIGVDFVKPISDGSITIKYTPIL